jgi:hypothetical protein
MNQTIVYVLPFMISLVKKKKGNRLYYYLVESARVDGQPRIVHQAYLGTAEKLAQIIQQNTAPVPSPPACDARSSFSGAIDGRPSLEYMRSSSRDNERSTSSTIVRIARKGWSFPTRCSGER